MPLLVANLFQFFCVVLLRVYVLSSVCDVRYVMFGSSLPLVVCMIAYIRYLYLFAYSGVQYILCLPLFWLSSYCVPYGASFSGLSLRYSVTFIYYSEFSKERIKEIDNAP